MCHLCGWYRWCQHKMRWWSEVGTRHLWRKTKYTTTALHWPLQFWRIAQCHVQKQWTTFGPLWWDVDPPFTPWSIQALWVSNGQKNTSHWMVVLRGPETIQLQCQTLRSTFQGSYSHCLWKRCWCVMMLIFQDRQLFCFQDRQLFHFPPQRDVFWWP